HRSASTTSGWAAGCLLRGWASTVSRCWPSWATTTTRSRACSQAPASLARISALADVAELVDAHGSGPCGRKVVEVQVLSSALHTQQRGQTPLLTYGRQVSAM